VKYLREKFYQLSILTKNDNQRCSFFLIAQKPVTLLNTSLSLDVLDILLREKQQLNDDDCAITDVFLNKQNRRNDDDIVQLLSSDNTDDDKDVLPLPLWDRIRQRTAV